jgi:hypothetical protein
VFETCGADVFKNLILLVVIIATFCFTACSFAKDKEAGGTKMKTIGFDDLQLSVTEKPGDTGYLLQFLRDGRTIFTGECAFRLYEPRIISGVPLANCRSLLAYCFSGGAHCCTTLVIATNCGPQKTLATIDLAHSADEVKFVSADSQAAKEMRIVDWQLAYYGPENSDHQLSFADSPGMDRLLVFDNGKWRVDRIGEFSRYYEARFSKSRNAALLASKKRKDEELAAAGAIQAAYYFLMSGKSVEETEEILNRLLPQSWKPESGKVAEDIRRAVTEFSPVEEIQ